MTPPLVGNDAHLQLNPVLQELLAAGVGQGKLNYKFPPSRFRDEQQHRQREELLSRLLDDEDFRGRFFRDSPVAPHVIKLGEQSHAGESTVRYAEFLFSIYAELDEVMQSDFFGRLGQAASDAEAQQDDTQSTERHVLTDAELADRQIELGVGVDRREAFAFGKLRLLKRVDVAATTHSCWSKSPQSVVAAFVVDTRFQRDVEFPNCWWPLARDDAGDLVVGEPQVYQGAGGYLRLTQLAEPQGCLIAEGYLAFVEPQGWFQGANLLASKLPTIVQTGIRRTRQSLRD